MSLRSWSKVIRTTSRRLVISLALLLVNVAHAENIDARSQASEEPLRIAAASNFYASLQNLVAEFEQRTDHRVTVSYGSTGKLYAQIRNGAPFAVFLAADAKRPQLLVEQGRAVAGSGFTYAQGRLLLWIKNNSQRSSLKAALSADYQRLAIANPKLAPYGVAAMEVLESLQLLDVSRPKLVFGENIAQAFQFVHTGHAELGLIAAAQARSLALPGQLIPVPTALHQPIEQQAVMLKPTTAAKDFLEFLRSDLALQIIRRNGYDTP